MGRPGGENLRFDPVQVDQRLAQHLQAAADAQHAPAARGVPRDGGVQPLRAQPGQVGGGGLAAGQDDPVHVIQLGRAARPGQAHAGHVLERLELVQVADARIGDDSHARVHRAAAARAVVEHAVFLGQAVAEVHRHHGQGGHAGELLQLIRPGRQQRWIATELVEHETAQTRPVLGRQQRPGAVQVGQRAAAVDVGHQQAARIGVARHAQVDHVAGHQIQLGGRAGAFDHHHVVFGAQRVQCGGDGRPHALAALAPRQRAQFAVHLPQQHHLAARVRFGLEQQRVHAHVGHGARGQGLEVLGAADFPQEGG